MEAADYHQVVSFCPAYHLLLPSRVLDMADEYMTRPSEEIVLWSGIAT